jgi:hypothetical protein
LARKSVGFIRETEEPFFMFEQATALAKLADVAICVVGYNYLDEGEFVGVEMSGPWTARFPKPTADDAPFAREAGRFPAVRSYGAYGGDRDSLSPHPEDANYPGGRGG